MEEELDPRAKNLIGEIHEGSLIIDVKNTREGLSAEAIRRNGHGEIHLTQYAVHLNGVETPDLKNDPLGLYGVHTRGSSRYRELSQKLRGVGH